jgi:type I restriction enzyme S subunit
MTNNTWQITPIGEQIELLTDYTANGSFAGLKQNVQYYNQSNYAALVRTTDLEKKVFAPERFTDKKGYDFLKKSSLTGGEIVLANVGSIGKVYRVPQYHLPMTLAPNMYLIRFKESIDKKIKERLHWFVSISYQ